MKTRRIVLISVVLGLSLGSAVQLGMFNGFTDGALSFFNGLFPDNVGANVQDSGLVGNSNQLPTGAYDRAQETYFDKNLQQSLLKESFGDLDGGFSTSYQISVGVVNGTYFDFETGLSSQDIFNSADFYWNAGANFSYIDTVNRANFKNLGLTPFGSVDASTGSVIGPAVAQSTSDFSSSFGLGNGSVLLWHTSEGNIYRMRIDVFSDTLVFTYDSVYYISVDGNDNFLLKAKMNGWPGDGTTANPIIIQGYNITASQYAGFSISNTNLNFVMQMNSFNGLGSGKQGILFDNVTNGVFQNNNVTAYGQAFGATGSKNLMLNGNYVHNNGEQGFFIEGSNSITVDDNTVNKNGASGVLIYKTGAATLSGNTFDSNSYMALKDPTILSASINLVFSSVTVTYNNITNSYALGSILFGSNGVKFYSNMILSSAHDGMFVLGTEESAIILNTIDGNLGAGLSVSSSQYLNVNDNMITNNGENGIFWINSSYSTLKGNTASSNINVPLANQKTGSINPANSYNGLFMDPSFFNVIEGNTFSNNAVGVYLKGSDFNTFSGNTINNNAQDGFAIIDSSSNTVHGNKLTGNNNPYTMLTLQSYLKPGSLNPANSYNGLFMDPSSNNNITENEISGNYGTGVYILDSSYNKLDNNTVSGNALDGAYIVNSTYNTITNNEFNGNAQPALQAEYYSVLKVGSLNPANSYNGLFMDPSEHNVIAGNTFKANYGNGVYFQASDNNYLTGNQIADNAINGVVIEESNGNNINENHINGNGNPAQLAVLFAYGKADSINPANSYNGLFMDPSEHNNLMGNDISNNYGAGATFVDSNKNNFDSNTINANGADGVYVENSNNNQITNNDISGNSNGALFSALLSTVNNYKPGSLNPANSYNGLFMDPSSGNTVSGNTIDSNAGRGVWVQASSSNTFDGNSITNSGTDGFFLENSNYNNVTYNTISGSGNSAVLNNFLAFVKPDSLNPANSYNGLFMDPSEGNIVAYNKISHNNGNGVQALSSSGNAVFYNEIGYNTGHGYYSTDSNSNAVKENSFAYNKEYGTFFDSNSQKSDVEHNDYVANNEGTGHKQGYDDGIGNIYTNNFLLDANPSKTYYFDGSADSYDKSPSYTPSTDLSSYNFPPISVQFDLRARSLNVDSHGRWMSAKITFPDGYSAYLVNTTTIYAVWNGHYYPITRAYVLDTSTIIVKFDRHSLSHDLDRYYHEFDDFHYYRHHRWIDTVNIGIKGQFNGGFLTFIGSDTIKAFDW